MRKQEIEDLLENYKRSQNKLRAKLCMMVESWGVGPKREQAMIATIKNVSYDNDWHFKELLRDMLLEELEREAHQPALCGAKEE